MLSEEFTRGFYHRLLFSEDVVFLSGFDFGMAEDGCNVGRAEPESVEHCAAGLTGKVEMDVLLNANLCRYFFDDAVGRGVTLHAFAEPRDWLVSVEDFLPFTPEECLDRDSYIALCLIHPFAQDTAADVCFVERKQVAPSKPCIGSEQEEVTHLGLSASQADAF